ncbi:MAG TPA: restriction endonuclease subunit S [Pyrinomonadaceae bacterium]|jgi:type I restriction enzyme S subunit|nr:restriction endonuclease subunit S [Pyrinomonadaceae bacterium]
MKLEKILRYKKGKSPQKSSSTIDNLVLYLTPEYLRNNSEPNYIPGFSSMIKVTDKDLVLLWDGSNAGEFFRAKNGVLASTMVKFIFDENEFNTNFLYYQLKNVEAFLKSQTNGSGIPHVDKEILLNLELESFDEPEQDYIAKILLTTDEAIEQTQALIDKYNRIKRGLMQELLTRGIDEDGNIRSKQTHKFIVKNGIDIPEDWDIVRVDELLNNKGFIQTGPFGSQLHSYEYTYEGVPVIMPQDMLDEISTKNINRIPEIKANELDRHRVCENDVIFARRGDLTRCNVIQSHQVGWLCGTGCILLRQRNKVFNPDWLRLFYKSFYGQLQVSINAVGSTMANLSGSLLKNLWICKVNIEEQNRIVDRVNQINRTIQNYIDHRAKLQAVKNGLMQDLLGGKVRVN